MQPRGEGRRDAGERKEIETEKEQEKEEMSSSLKKSCPNKGALFHAQCTPPQTRSLKYLSLRGARCSSALLSTPHEFLSLLSFLFETLESKARHPLRVYIFLLGKCVRGSRNMRQFFNFVRRFVDPRIDLCESNARSFLAA